MSRFIDWMNRPPGPGCGLFLLAWMAFFLSAFTVALAWSMSR